MQQRRKARFALDQRPDADILAIEMQKVEDEEHQPSRIAGVRCRLDHAEGGDAVGEDPAQLAVDIGLLRSAATAATIAGYLRVQSSPVRVRSFTAPRSRRACMRSRRT